MQGCLPGPSPYRSDSAAPLGPGPSWAEADNLLDYKNRRIVDTEDTEIARIVAIGTADTEAGHIEMVGIETAHIEMADTEVIGIASGQNSPQRSYYDHSLYRKPSGQAALPGKRGRHEWLAEEQSVTSKRLHSAYRKQHSG